MMLIFKDAPLEIINITYEMPVYQTLCIFNRQICLATSSTDKNHLYSFWEVKQ